MAPGEDGIEVLVAQLAHEAFDVHRLVMGDGGVDDAADLAVARFVDLVDELLFGRDDDARLAKARQEHVDVLRSLDDIVLRGEVPTADALRDRARGPHLGEQLVGNVRPLERIDLD